MAGPDGSAIDPRVLTLLHDATAPPQPQTTQSALPPHPASVSPHQASQIAPGESLATSYGGQQQHFLGPNRLMQQSDRETSRAMALARANQTMSSLYGRPQVDQGGGNVFVGMMPQLQSSAQSLPLQGPLQSHSQFHWIGAAPHQSRTDFSGSRQLPSTLLPSDHTYQYFAAAPPSLPDIEEDDSDDGGEGGNSGKS